MIVVWDGIGEVLLCGGRLGSGFRIVAEAVAAAGCTVLPVSVRRRRD
jgi:hypothetical protein